MRFLLLTATMLCSFNLAADQELIMLTRTYEQQLNIPPYLIYAIAHQEAGRTVKGEFKPWRWTLNVEGKGYYFATRNDAEKFLLATMEATEMVDIGLMEVNWYWNGERFDSPESALDPETNVRVGSEILREWYDSTGSWVEAIARYHTGPITSQSELDRARQYATRVMHHHERILEALNY